MAVDVGHYTIDDFTGVRGRQRLRIRITARAPKARGFRGGRAGTPVAPSPDSCVLSALVSSERLSYAERKIKMPGALVPKLPDFLPRHGVGRNVRIAGKVGWIQIVSEIETQWSDRRLIAHPQAYGVRGIVVIALQVRDLLKTELLVGLVKTSRGWKAIPAAAQRRCPYLRKE
jgi:hypothetical protein